MLKYDLFLLAFLITGLKGMSQDSIPLAFSSEIFYDVYDEWIEIKIINDETDSVWYDTTATVFYDGGFSDTIYLDSGSYKFYIPDIGANVSMPVLTICQHVIPWHVSGEGSDEYYAFTLPCTYFFDNIPENSGDSYCRIYPNPAKDIVYLTFDSNWACMTLKGPGSWNKMHIIKTISCLIRVNYCPAFIICQYEHRVR